MGCREERKSPNNVKRRALVIGHSGQDGWYLYEYLAAKGYAVCGIGRDSIRQTDEILPDRPIDIMRRDVVEDMLNRAQPDEIYYLAAHHHSSEMDQGDIGQLVRESFNVHVDGVTNFLDAARLIAPSARLFYAASSHVFGNPEVTPQKEDTPFRPTSAYAISKTAGVEICRLFRKEHGVFASCGILYTHESPRRADAFLSRKIVRTAVSIANGGTEQLRVGDLNAMVDYGFVADYVDAMWRILQLDAPDDFIIATGRLSSVRDFIAAVFARLDLDWREHTIEDSSIMIRTNKRQPLSGDTRKLQAATGWVATHSMEDLARILVDAERDKGCR